MLRKTDVIQAFRSRRAASGVEYALVIGLIAVVGILGVQTLGNSVARILGNANTAIAGSDSSRDNDDVPAPTVDLTASNLFVPVGGAVTFTWTTRDATSLAASYTLGGACAKLDDDGSGPHGLGWADLDDSADIDWAADIAGCSLTLALAAGNADGSAVETAEITFEALDITPENLSFQAVSLAEPGQPIISNPEYILDVNADIEISATGAKLSLAPDGTPQDVLTASPGSQVRLHAEASMTFGETRDIAFSAGNHSGIWQITTRDPSSVAQPFNLGDDFLGLNGNTEKMSEPVTFTGFDIPLTLELAATGSTLAGTRSYRLDSGGGWSGWIPYDAGANVTIPGVVAGTMLQLRVVTAPSYQTVAQIAGTTVSIGSRSDSWEVGLRAYSTAIAPFSFGADDFSSTPGQYSNADILTFTGFDDQKTLTIDPNVNLAAGKLTYQLVIDGISQGWTALTGSGLVFTIGAGTQLQVRLYTAETIPATTQAASVSVSIGGLSDSWIARFGPTP